MVQMNDISNITVDGKVLEVIDVVDIVPGKLKKSIIKHGDGNSPSKEQMCTMHYTGVLEKDGSKFDSSRDRNDPFVFKIGVGQVIQGWEQGVITMTTGEECVLHINSEFGYGAQGAGAAIPGGADLMFHVELISFADSEKELYEMSTAEKMTFAEEKKLMGNTMLKAKNYSGAIAAYSKALEAFDQDENAIYEGSHFTLKLALHSNCAIACNASGNFIEAVRESTNALRMDARNTKANFNKVKAYASMGEFREALKHLDSVLGNDQISVDDMKMFQRQRAQLKKDSAEQDKKERAVYSKMFA